MGYHYIILNLDTMEVVRFRKKVKSFNARHEAGTWATAHKIYNHRIVEI